MVKFAWPSSLAQRSLGLVMRRGGISEDGEMGMMPRWRWKEDIDGFEESGGEGKPAMRGVGRGVLSTEEASGSATVGDCSGDWYGTSLI